MRLTKIDVLLLSLAILLIPASEAANRHFFELSPAFQKSALRALLEPLGSQFMVIEAGDAGRSARTWRDKRLFQQIQSMANAAAAAEEKKRTLAAIYSQIPGNEEICDAMRRRLIPTDFPLGPTPRSIWNQCQKAATLEADIVGLDKGLRGKQTDLLAAVR